MRLHADMQPCPLAKAEGSNCQGSAVGGGLPGLHKPEGSEAKGRRGRLGKPPLSGAAFILAGARGSHPLVARIIDLRAYRLPML